MPLSFSTILVNYTQQALSATTHQYTQSPIAHCSKASLVCGWSHKHLAKFKESFKFLEFQFGKELSCWTCLCGSPASSPAALRHPGILPAGSPVDIERTHLFASVCVCYCLPRDLQILIANQMCRSMSAWSTCWARAISRPSNSSPILSLSRYNPS